MTVSDIKEQEALDRIVEYAISQVNTTIPAEVTKYNKADQTVDVLVHFTEYLETDETSEEETWAPLAGVPVMFPQANAGNVSITLPIKKGDIVMLSFAQRSLDEWRQTQGNQAITPRDLRMHSASDAVAYLGPGTEKRKLPGDAVSDDNIIIKVSDTQIIVKPDGTVVVKGNRLEIGAEGASSALLVDKLVNGLSAYINQNTIITNDLGVTLGKIPVPYPPLVNPDIASTKAFTND